MWLLRHTRPPLPCRPARSPLTPHSPPPLPVRSEDDGGWQHVERATLPGQYSSINNNPLQWEEDIAL